MFQRFQPGMINSSGPTIPVLASPQAHYNSPQAGFVSNSSGPGNNAGGSSPFSGIQNQVIQNGMKQGVKKLGSELMPDSVKTFWNDNVTLPYMDNIGHPLNQWVDQNITQPFDNFKSGLGDQMGIGDGVSSGAGQPASTIQMAELPQAPSTGLLAEAPTSYGPLASEAPGAFAGGTGAPLADGSMANMGGLFSSDFGAAGALDTSALGAGGTEIGAGWGAGLGEAGAGATAGAEAGATASEGAGALAAASAESAPAWGPMAWIPLAIAAAAMADNATGGHIIAAPMESLGNLANGSPFSELGDANWWGNISGYNSLFGDGGLFG